MSMGKKKKKNENNYLFEELNCISGLNTSIRDCNNFSFYGKNKPSKNYFASPNPSE